MHEDDVAPYPCLGSFPLMLQIEGVALDEAKLLCVASEALDDVARSSITSHSPASHTTDGNKFGQRQLLACSR